MSRYIFSKNSRWYISEVFDPSDSKLQEKASYYTLTDDVTGPYYAVGTSDSASIGVSYVPVVEPAGAIEAGYINAEGNFQPLSFDGTQASDSGSAVEGLQHKIFNTGHEEPDYGGSGGATVEFYKCATVDTSNSTWTGYKAVQDHATGVYSFEATATSGLTYSVITPQAGKIYADGALVEARLWNGMPISGMVFYAPLETSAAAAETGQAFTVTGSPVYATYLGVPCAQFSGYDVIEVSNTNIPYSENPFSISLWLNVASNPSGDSGSVTIGSDNAYGAMLAILYNPTGIGLSGHGPGYGMEGSAPITFNGSWLHVAAVFGQGENGERPASIYINGVLAQSGTFMYDASAYESYTSKLFLGSYWGNATYLPNLTGYLAAIRIYNRALTAAEIAALAAEFTPTA